METFYHVYLDHMQPWISLGWELTKPKIDPDSLENFSSECPRVKVNPQPSPFGYKGGVVPREALPNTVLDDPIVEDIDPSTWATCGLAIKAGPPVSSPSELSMAEKFRLAFVERDMRLAPKRAKNARQHQRRAEREWMMTSTEAKAIAHASSVSKSLRIQSSPDAALKGSGKGSYQVVDLRPEN
ncbi:hypothetical protein Cgig2_019557 [Carnegiea gigantea]|uniref:Uncharacterized protein n=1 Tax=Carnegiea gigantea TaxID=171969 RepID=A0A9Q1KGB0_9CARY|nr:hypothetical protein Cgig2_019557 [Carnegiea gigantea]